jgi:hypothetical protein
MKRKVSTLLFTALVQVASVTVPSVILPTAAEAVVGRPATPGSVAGMSRRTARRTSRRVSHRHAVARPNAYYGAPVAGAAVAGAAVTATALAIGTVVASQPSGCGEQMVGGLTYLNCDGTWFQPQYQGGQVVYVVVAPPG